jgi:hypothetical protein
MKFTGLFLSAGAVTSIIAAAPAMAQIASYDQGSFYIQGMPAFCEGTTTQIFNTLPDLIIAPDYYTVNINGPAFDTLPAGIQLFAYYNTCSKLFYRDDVAAADAQTVRTGVGQHWLAPADLQQMCETDILAQANWIERPDATRCAAMYDTMRTLLNQ